LPSATVPLGNTGVTPPATTLSAVDIDAKMNHYGQYIILNEQVTLQNQDPALNEAAARLGVSLRQTEDELTRNMLAGTAAQINCVGGVNGDNPTEITPDDISVVVRTLLGNNAYTIMDNIEGEDKFGTAPIRDAYFALCHTDMSGDLNNTDGFIHKNAYPSPMNTLRSEWGSIQNLRFLLSSAGSKSTAGSAFGDDVYNIFCVGMEAYACIEQDNYSSQFIYRPPVYDSPLALNCSVGYKFAEVPRITNDLWVINLRATLA
jgi:N4-gp56 family major capsid protein